MDFTRFLRIHQEYLEFTGDTVKILLQERQWFNINDEKQLCNIEIQNMAIVKKWVDIIKKRKNIIREVTII